MRILLKGAPVTPSGITERTVCHGGQVFDVPSKERKINAEQNQVKVVTDESLEAAVKRFRQNSYWRGVYDNAPEKAKRLYALQFWPSVNVDLYDRCKSDISFHVDARQELVEKACEKPVIEEEF